MQYLIDEQEKKYFWENWLKNDYHFMLFLPVYSSLSTLIFLHAFF